MEQHILTFTTMLNLSPICNSDFDILRKHDNILKQQEKELLEERYKTRMMEQKEMLKREQADAGMKQKLLALQVEMLQTELQQAELIKKLEATQEKIYNINIDSKTVKNIKQKHNVSEVSSITTCDYYHGPISWQESSELLKSCSAGTFLVRDSQDPKYMYSLSFQRGEKEGGPTSVRIRLDRGRWSLDSQDSIQDLMPSFTSIVGLIQYYVNLTLGGAEDYHIKLRTGLRRR